MRLFPARKAPPRPPPPRPRAVLAKEARLEQWRALTLKGNLAFEQGQIVRSRRLYEEALTVAEALLADAIHAKDSHAAGLAPLLHGITCSNIVELARQQGDRETVGVYLYRRASSLISVVESQAPLELRSRCLLHLEVAASSLYDYFDQGGMWDAAAAFSERANAAMFSVRRVEVADLAFAPDEPLI